jgi:hypothetical protein
VEATVWCKTIREVFRESEGEESALSIDVAPLEDFRLGITYRIGTAPKQLTVSIRPDETVETDDPEVEAAIAASAPRFLDVIAHLLPK